MGDAVLDTGSALKPSSGLEAVFLANRGRLLRFLRARGAGNEAEDLLQEVWVRIFTAPPGPVAAPLSYLFRTADRLLIDRYRAARQATRRDTEWSKLYTEGGEASDQPSVERHMIAREETAAIIAVLNALPPRVAAAFRRHKLEGAPQRQVAMEFSVSISTVESDLRVAYQAISHLKYECDRNYPLKASLL